MKIPARIFFAFLCLIFVGASRADILTGPITNPANGHNYYLLTPNSWTASQAEAISLRGNLVTINDAEENDWVYTTFSSYEGGNRALWIGLNDQAQEGTFVWASGQTTDYSNWRPGEPNGFTGENFVNICPPDFSPGQWNDLEDFSTFFSTLNGVVEVESLTNAPPNIDWGPLSQTVALGTNVLFTVSVSGTPPFEYQWFFNNVPLIDSTNSFLSIIDVQLTNAGNYSVFVTNAFGSTNSSNALLTVAIPVEITSQPQGGTVIVGTNFTFNVSVTGDEPLFYQWRTNGVNIADANNASLTLTDIQLMNAGTYSVSVSNLVSSVVSSDAVLLVEPPTVLTGPITNPANGHQYYLLHTNSWTASQAEAIKLGGNLVTINDAEENEWVYTTFSSYEGGNRALWTGLNDQDQEGTFVWVSGQTTDYNNWRPGEPNGSTGENFVNICPPDFSPGQWNDLADFTTFFSTLNGVVEVDSTNAPPVIVGGPRSKTAALGSNVLFSVSVAGTPPFEYQWFFNDIPLIDSTNSSLLLTDVQLTNAGNYSVFVTNAFGSTNSSNAVLTVINPVIITAQPEGGAVAVGTNFTFSVSVSGDGPVFFQWRTNGVNIAGATNSSLSLTNIQFTNARTYSVSVSNLASSVLSSNAVLTVFAFPVITTQPQSQTAFPGTNLTLVVRVNEFLPSVSSGTVRLWLKADAGVIKDELNRVSQWQDQSAQTNHASQASVNRQPRLMGSAFNGRAVIRFDGLQDASEGDFLFGQGDVGLSNGFTSFLVYARTNRPVLEEIPTFIGVPGTARAARAFSITNNEMRFSTWITHYGSGFSVPPSTYRIGTERLNAGKTIIEFFDTNGTNNFSTGRSTSGLLTPASGYYVGGLDSSPGNFQGDIAEIVYYQGALTETDRTSVDSYLRKKYFGASSGFGYQWQLNGTNLIGATNSSLVLSNAQPVQSGSYKVLITNQAVSVTSDIATVRVRHVFAFGNGQLLTNAEHSFGGGLQISFQSSFTNGTIFYTLDGSAPSFASESYNGPFALNQSAMVRAIAYSSDFFQSGETDPVYINILPTYTLTGLTAGGGSVAMEGTGPFVSNSVINVTATSSNGWVFLQWLGDASGTNSTTAVTMTRNKSIRAVFGTTLNTTAAGNGAVSVNPAVPLYPFGSVVRLTALPGGGSFFGLWGNAASGNTNPLDYVVINPTPTVSSLFSTLGANQFSLTLSSTGFGRATASPRANVYTTGQNVTLTATPDIGQTFLGWTGDASGTANPLALSMNQSRYVTANFSKNPRLALEFMPNAVAMEGFRLTLAGGLGESYSLQKSTNLVDWSTFFTVTDSLGTIQVSDLPSTNSNLQFYRAIQP